MEKAAAEGEKLRGEGKAAKKPPRKKKKNFHIDIFPAWCKRCGICIAFCPKEVLVEDDAGYPSAKNPEACSGCMWCELRCPDFAITVLAEAPEQQS